jgi:hypothetical protein
MGSLGVMPPGFSLGAVVPLLKPGAPDATAPAAYRPITLLNSLYRILAKVLAARFGDALAGSIGEEQTAFLPGRRIGDNVTLGQLLPAVMASAGVSGAVLFIDIAKAFDTGDRRFLVRLMEAMGASQGMVGWVELLLSDTAASAVVNGAVSAPLRYHAGVRQGCPLSPVLYLFFAQALASFLRSQPLLGVRVEGVTYVSAHHADDTKVFLADLSPAALQQLLDTLQAYGAASGQLVNVAKSSALLVGAPLGGPPPQQLAGVPVVQHVRSLGVLHWNSPLPPRPTAARVLRSASQPPPFPEPPLPEAVTAAWERRVEGVVACLGRLAGLPLSAMGKGLGASAYACSTVFYHAEFEGLPAESERAVAEGVRRTVGGGIPGLLMSGGPARGGFGVLPVGAHVRARHAHMACRLLMHLVGGAPLLWGRLAACLLRRACPAVPPALAMLSAAQADLEDLRRGLLGLPRGLHQLFALPEGPLRRMALGLRALGPLCRFGDGGQLLLLPATGVASLPAAAAEQLGWAHPMSRPAQPLPPLLPGVHLPPVATLTSLLLSGVHLQRKRAHTAYVSQALQQGAGQVQQQRRAFVATLGAVWRLPWENARKEALWRLAVNGIPGAQVHGPCACGAPAPAARHPQHNRMHAFWECPVARAVTAQLAAGAGVGVGELQRSSVWLLLPPSPDLWVTAWQVAALAALDAMEYGRRFLWFLRARPGFAAAAGVERVSRAAAARFWFNLQDFAAGQGVQPQGWPAAGAQGLGGFFSVVEGRLLAAQPPAVRA